MPIYVWAGATIQVRVQYTPVVPHAYIYTVVVDTTHNTDTEKVISADASTEKVIDSDASTEKVIKSDTSTEKVIDTDTSTEKTIP